MVWADPKVENFTITLDYDNQFLGGGGSGWNSGDFIYYPNTYWWNQWFYDDPPDPDRWKKITYDIDIDVPDTPPPLDLDVFVVINWSTMDFLETGPDGSPPIPPLTPAEESLYIVRQGVGSHYFGATSGHRDLIGEITIPDYNPEWVSIDVRVGGSFGQATVSGTITHECIPEPATLGLLGLGALALMRRRRG
jgi:hypothetical protein